MSNTLHKLFNVSRPISWVNTAYPFAATYLVLGGRPGPLFFIGTLFFLIPYNLLLYGINDVFDYESDIRNPRKNSIEGAAEAKSFHPTILWASFILTVPFVIAILLLTPRFTGLIFVGVLFFVIAYSLRGLRFKEKPFVDSITSSLHFAGPMVVAVAVTGFQIQAWPFVIALFLWGVASHAFGAVQDVIPDRAAGLGSIATVLGARRTVLFSFVTYFAALVSVASAGGFAVIVGIVGIVYLLNVMPYLKITDATSAKANKGWRRFIWLNYAVGAVVTVVIILSTSRQIL